MQRGYERALRVVLRHQPLTLLIFLVTVRFPSRCTFHAERLLPAADTGFIQGVAESSQDTSFAAMRHRALAVADVVRNDPDVYSVAVSVGSGTYNNASFSITLRPKESGREASVDQIIARLRPKIAALQDVNLYMQASQDITVGEGSPARSTIHIDGCDIAELSVWAPRLLERLAAAAARRCGVRSELTHPPLNLTLIATAHRRMASHPPRSTRAVRRDRPAADHAVLHPVERPITWCSK